MSSNSFTKGNLDTYLKELAKEMKRLNGRSVHAEIVLVGGAAILTNYGFRDMTSDIDAVIHANSSMKEAINAVGDKFDLPNGWLNADFMHTGSYSSKYRPLCHLPPPAAYPATHRDPPTQVLRRSAPRSCRNSRHSFPMSRCR